MTSGERGEGPGELRAGPSVGNHFLRHMLTTTLWESSQASGRGLESGGVGRGLEQGERARAHGLVVGEGDGWGSPWKGLLSMSIGLKLQPAPCPGAKPARKSRAQILVPRGVAWAPHLAGLGMAPSVAVPLFWAFFLICGWEQQQFSHPPHGEQGLPGLSSSWAAGVLGQGWPFEPTSLWGVPGSRSPGDWGSGYIRPSLS